MRFRGNWASPLAFRGFGSIAMLLLAACAGTIKPVSEIRPTGSHPTVYVVHHGTLHTGLVVKRSDILRGHWPASADFADSKYIEVGWGDDDGYRKPLTSGIATKALLGDRQTVLLADGFSQSPARKYGNPKFTVLAVDLSEAGFTQLCDHIQQTYAADENGTPIRLGAGWYRARGTYSAFNTCNTWVAAGLHKAGCPISPALCLTAGQLLGRVRPFARVVSTRR
jgi:hypothetical protein